jgi:BirA family biotin operon repressor/biotin-[acetyl-CoA-carboxylase] ligase
MRDFQPHAGAVLGRPYQFWPETTSTNELLKAWAKAGAPHGALIAADFQRTGRGRRGRPWLAAPGEAILASVLLRGTFPVDRLGLYSLGWAVAVAEALEPYVGRPVETKWPNDVEVDGRKIAGILVEAALRQRAVEFLVVGMGVNVRQAAFPPEVADRATSLYLLTGRDEARERILADILRAGERVMRHLQDEAGQAAVRAAFEERFRRWLGQDVLVEVEGRRESGRLVGIDERGFLVLEAADGPRRLPVGEVSLRREADA